MLFLISKFVLTAAVIVIITEVAKRSDRLGGLIAALPLVTIMALIWLHLEGQPADKVRNHAWYTFWYVLPTLPMFLAFPFLHARFGFWPTLLASALITFMCFGLLAWLMKYFGVHLL